LNRSEAIARDDRDRICSKEVVARRGVSQVLSQSLEERVPHLRLGGLGPILHLGKQLRFDPDAFVSDPLRAGLRLPDQQLQPLLQVGGGDLVEAVPS
jgi:hypothetical protein